MLATLGDGVELFTTEGSVPGRTTTPFDDLLATMGLDKKTRGSTLRFVVLNGLASAEILAGPDEDLLRSAYSAVAV